MDSAVLQAVLEKQLTKLVFHGFQGQLDPLRATQWKRLCAFQDVRKPRSNVQRIEAPQLRLNNQSLSSLELPQLAFTSDWFGISPVAP